MLGYDCQLGDNTISAKFKSKTPVNVNGLTGVKQITAGYKHSCAALESGTAKRSGWNDDGQLGDNTAKLNRKTPVVVTGLTGVKQIAAGDRHTCAALHSGTVKCWGEYNWGQLGGNNGKNSNTPVNDIVTGLTGVKQNFNLI